jgi:LEA14-like dessication related protein
MTTKKQNTVLVAALTAVLVSSCVRRVEQPDVWLNGARLVSLGITGGVIDVELGVYNPNSFVVRAGGLSYDLDFEDPGGEDWLDFAEGRIDDLVPVPARDTATVVVPVEFDYRGLGAAVRALLERGSFQYRVSGLVAVEEPVVRDIRYRHSGTVTPDGIR